MRSVLLLILLASSAHAEGQAWSMVGARTVGLKGRSAEASVGWPAVSVAYRFGMLEQLDLGAKVGFVYGQEGLVSRVMPGVKAQALLAVRIVDSERVSLGATFEPGLFVNLDRVGTSFPGVSLPLGVRLGLAASSAIGLALTFDVPMWVLIGVGGGLNVPLLPGVGGEYFISSDVVVFARVKMGPTLRQRGAAEFTLDAQVGVGWKL